MADEELLGRLAVEVEGRFAHFERQMGRVEARFRAAGDRMEATSRRVTGAIGGAFRRLGGALTGYLGYRAFAGFFGAVSDLEDRFADLRKVTGDAFPEIREDIKALASETRGVSVEDLIELATAGRRLGVMDDQLVKFTEHLGMMKVALNDIDAEELATQTARILNVFGTAPTEAGRFGSALNMLSDSAAASAGEILDLTRRMAGAASTLGMSEQEVLGLATAMLEAGVNVEVGGTAVSQVLGKMATDTEKFARVAGVSVRQFEGVLRNDALAALALFQRGLMRFDELGRFQALESLGLEGARVGMTMLQLGRTMGRVPGFVRAANAEWGSMASLMREAEIRGETLSGRMDQLGNRLKATADTVGQELGPVFGGFFDALNTGFEGFQASVEENRGAIGDFATSVAEVGGAILSQWDLIWQHMQISAESRLSAGFQAVQWFFRQVGVGVDYLWNNWRDAFDNILNFTTTVLQNLGKAINAFFDSGFDFSKLTDVDLTEGFQWKGAAPEFEALTIDTSEADAKLADLQERMAKRMEQALGLDDAEGAGAKAGEALAEAAGRMGQLGGGEGEGGTAFAGGGDAEGRAQAAFLNAEDFARRIQMAAVGRDGAQAEIARTNRQTAVATGRMALMLEQIARRMQDGRRIMA